jgi:hypothetical protein
MAESFWLIVLGLIVIECVQVITTTTAIIDETNDSR